MKYAMMIGVMLLTALSAGAHATDKADKGKMGAAAYMEPMESMNKKMDAMKPTGDTDMDFAMMMAMHHQSAVEMAEVYLQRGDDAKLKAFAEKVISDQKREIDELENWQRQNAKQ